MKICKVKIDDSWQEVPFYGVFQYSDVIGSSLMVGGHPGGVIAYPVAVVELENQLIMRSIDSVKDIKNAEAIRKELKQMKEREIGEYEEEVSQLDVHEGDY